MTENEIMEDRDLNLSYQVDRLTLCRERMASFMKATQAAAGNCRATAGVLRQRSEAPSIVKMYRNQHREFRVLKGEWQGERVMALRILEVIRRLRRVYEADLRWTRKDTA